MIPQCRIMRDTRKLDREMARVKASCADEGGEADVGSETGVSERRARKLALAQCKSLGYGFAQFDSHECALAALNALNNRADVFPNHQVNTLC